MINKLIVKLVFCAAVITATCAAVGAEAQNTQPKAATAAKAEKQAGPDVTVYYFHGGARCSNCIKFEQYTNETMKSTFADALKAGKVAWKVVDYDKPENKHFMQDYQLMTKSVVVVKMKDGKPGKFKNLTGIWQLVGDKPGFQKYIAQEVSSVMKAGQ